MRVIERKVIGAFLNGQKLTISNTSTNGRSLFLHGHEIAREAPLGLYKPPRGAAMVIGRYDLSFCGWVTPTTQSRLNSLCQSLGLDRLFSIKGGVVRAMGEELPGDGFFQLTVLKDREGISSAVITKN